MAEGEVVQVAIMGAGLAGLALGIALQRLGVKGKVVIYEGRDAVGCESGQGMSVIGHSLILLRELGLPLHEVGEPQRDISLRDATQAHRVLYQVPLQADADLAAEFQNTVQYNVQRGGLFRALLSLFQQGGGEVRLKHRLASLEDSASGDGVIARFVGDIEPVTCQMVVGADGVHSVTRRYVLRDGDEPEMDATTASQKYLCDSGYSCWRGMLEDTDELSEPLGGKVMFKTVVSPSGTSFTSGTAPGNKRFWLLDVSGEGRPHTRALDRYQGKLNTAQARGGGKEKEEVVQEEVVTGDSGLVDEIVIAMKGYAPEMIDVVRATKSEDIITTDVFDGRLSALRRTARGRVVLIGDAAHPVVHHFGQGACMAFEDAVGLCKSIDKLGVDRIASSAAEMTADFDGWGRWLRASAILLLSRTCGALYMSHATFFTHPFLLICLAWPMCLAFTLIVKILLFSGGFHLRQFAIDKLGKKK